MTFKPRSGGRPTKDAPITDNFNRQKAGKKLSQREINALKQKAKRAAQLEKSRLEQAHKAQERELASIADQLAKVGKRVGVDVGEEAVEIPVVPPDSDPQDADDLKSAYQMLQDMRWVYRNVHGRKKLKALVDSDDKQFVFMVKELMKIEASLMAARIRKNEEPSQTSQQNFFVVLKGLEDEKKYLDVGKVDKDVVDTVDMKQIQRAINPDLSEVYEAEDEGGQRDAPEQLQRSVDSVDG